MQLFCPIFGEHYSNQGKLQGVNQSLQAANNMLIPLCAAGVYYYSVSMLYAIASIIVLIAVVFYSKYIPKTEVATI